MTADAVFLVKSPWLLFGSATSVVALLAIGFGCIPLASCYKPPPETLILNGSMLTVSNHTKTNWSNVEVWLNTYYRATFASIPAGGRMQAPLDFFVAGLGQRFSYARMQVRDLRLTAKLPDGTPLEIKKEFEGNAFDAVAKGAGRKR